MEEWVCAAPLTPERLGATDGILGSLDGQVVCNGDSTLIFGKGSRKDKQERLNIQALAAES